MSYPFQEVESKWQKRWEKESAFEAHAQPGKPKYYILDMFPYPSSSGLHVGHVEGYTASDIVTRFKRAQGFNVLHPMGWDAFGLPAEQFAIQTGVHPEITTRKAIATFKRQLKSLGFSYDWKREFATCDPSYYRWTQFIFLKLFEKGLAYQKEVAVNWCPALRTVLANEEVVDGRSERGGHPVERRKLRQWMLKITSYAERLIDDLDLVDWPERTKEAQRNWIGKSLGLSTDFAIKGSTQTLTIFTTRPDTIFGVTFMVLAPEHPLVEELTTQVQRAEVEAYRKQASIKSDRERQASTEKTGAFTGSFAINPANGAEIPIWISDYVLMDYGTGAVMAVPGHDARDFAFAQTFNLPIVRVIDGGDLPYEGDGVCLNSGPINGLRKDAAIEKMCEILASKNLARRQVHYKLRDWLFSRQRYWGEPFPIVHASDGTLHALPADELPVLLPTIESYEPSESGESPLARAGREWLNVDLNGIPALRDTDTMPGSAASSWYFLRFTDPNNDHEPFSFDAQEYWMPVDLYLGGAEHTVGHLLYARFWQKVLFDAGLVSHPEPFKKLVHQGMILGPDGEKMSKSRGNVINPDDVVAQHGADALRLYEMFMGPIDRDKPWQQNGLVGISKFLNRCWNLVVDPDGSARELSERKMDEALVRLMHQTIAKVTHDLENLSFNTAISQMMIFSHELAKLDVPPKQAVRALAQCLAPFAPHIAEEIWEKLDGEGLIALASWPEFDPELARAASATIAVQVNGKTRGTVDVEQDAEQDDAVRAAMALDAVARALDGKEPKKIIFVKNRIINFIV